MNKSKGLPEAPARAGMDQLSAKKKKNGKALIDQDEC